MEGRAIIACALCAVATLATMLPGDPVPAPAAVIDQGAQSSAAPLVGAVPDTDTVRMIDNLGNVGLGPELPGSRYAVVGGYLVRLDTSDGKILSVLRPLPRMPD